MGRPISKFQSAGSLATYNEARKVLSGGVNGDIKYRSPYPLFLSRGSGSHVFDIDGNEYIDYLLSYGALILGHGHRIVKETLINTLETEGTILFGNPSSLEIDFGEILTGIFMKKGMLRFTNSGMEATVLSVRLAIAATGRRKIAKFDGHYHGANPFLLANYRPKNSSRDEKGDILKEADSEEVRGDIIDGIVVLPFNDIEGTKRVLDDTNPAAVILEPFEDGYIPADEGFMKFLRKYTSERGILLIFDEVKTGLRVRIGGACEFYNVEPDLICLGKVIGGGTPVGAVVGKAEIMEMLDPRTSGKKVFHSGTFNGNPLTMKLGIATIRELMKDDNFKRLENTHSLLLKAFSESLDEFGIDHTLYGEGGIANFVIGKERIKTHRDMPEHSRSFRKLIDSSLIEHGVYVAPGNRFSLSLVHSEEDIEETRNILRKSISIALEKGGQLIKR